MAKLPFMQFYPADWLQDTQILTLEAQGAWIKLLCAMWVAPQRGKLDWNYEELSFFWGYGENDEGRLLTERMIDRLDGIADVTLKDESGRTVSNHEEACGIVIISRRMMREEHQRKQATERQSRHRHGSVTPSSRRIFQKSYIRNHIREDEPKTADPSVDNLKTNGEAKEAWREPAERIFNSDKPRFMKLIVWINQAKKQGYPETIIANSLTALEKYLPSLAGDWWPYLDKIGKKLYQNGNEARAIQEHENYKAGEKEWLAAFLRPISKSI